MPKKAKNNAQNAPQKKKFNNRRKQPVNIALIIAIIAVALSLCILVCSLVMQARLEERLQEIALLKADEHTTDIEEALQILLSQYESFSSTIGLVLAVFAMISIGTTIAIPALQEEERKRKLTELETRVDEITRESNSTQEAWLLSKVFDDYVISDNFSVANTYYINACGALMRNDYGQAIRLITIAIETPLRGDYNDNRLVLFRYRLMKVKIYVKQIKDYCQYDMSITEIEKLRQACNEAINTIIRIYPDKAFMALYEQGKMNFTIGYHTGDDKYYERSIDCFKEALSACDNVEELNKDFEKPKFEADCHYNLGRVWHHRGMIRNNDKNCQVTAEKELTDKPVKDYYTCDSDYYFVLANVYCALNDFKTASELCKEALNNLVQDEKIQAVSGMVSYKQKEYADAILALEYLVYSNNVNPSISYAYSYYGLAKFCYEIINNETNVFTAEKINEYQEYLIKAIKLDKKSIFNYTRYIAFCSIAATMCDTEIAANLTQSAVDYAKTLLTIKPESDTDKGALIGYVVAEIKNILGEESKPDTKVAATAVAEEIFKPKKIEEEEEEE